MITTQIIQCIDQELRDLNNRGLIARLFNRNARFELNLIRKTVLSFKSLEELKAQVKEPAEQSESDLMRDTALKENAIMLDAIREILKYYRTDKGEVVPAYLQTIIDQCEKKVAEEHTDFINKRHNLLSKQLAKLQKQVEDL